MTGPRIGSLHSKLAMLSGGESMFIECGELTVAQRMGRIGVTASRAGIAITQERYIAVSPGTTEAVNLIKVAVQ